MLLVAASLILLAAPVSADNEYNYFDFTRQWSPNSCYKASHHCKQLPDYISYWTLHGLWPSKTATEYPADCASSCHLNTTEIADLLDTMHKKWPTDYTGGDTKFWSHEYCKHGTCCTDVLQTEHDYFSKALQLNDQFDMDAALTRARITPSTEKSYTFEQFNAAMKSAFGVNQVSTWCRYVKESNGQSKQLLFQVSLCITKGFKARDCPKSAHNSCSEGKPIYFLPYSVL